MESDVVSAEYIPASARCSWSLFKMSQQICRHTIYYHTNSTLYMYLNLLGNSLKMLLCCCIFHFLYGIAVCCKKNWPHQWTLILITSSILKQSLSLLWFLFSIQRSTIHPSFSFPFLPLFIAVNMAIKREFDSIITMKTIAMATRRRRRKEMFLHRDETRHRDDEPTVLYNPPGIGWWVERRFCFNFHQNVSHSWVPVFFLL